MLPYAMAMITLLFRPPLDLLAAMLNFGLLFMITLVLISAMRLKKNHPYILENSAFKFSPRVITITALIAAIINVVFMVILAIAIPVSFFIFAGACCFGVVYYFARKQNAVTVPSFVQAKQDGITQVADNIPE